MDQTEKRRRGRPALPEEARRADKLSIRMYGDLRQRLEVLARRTNRSVSAQVEFMLEQALAESDIVDRVADAMCERLAQRDGPPPYINQSPAPAVQ